MTEAAGTTSAGFDPLEPFADRTLLEETLAALTGFEYKLYGALPKRLHRGEPTHYEFDLNLGVMHFTEQDFRGLSDLFRDLNARWGTAMTFCVYPSRESNREMILNVRGSPKAPSEID